jgi:hypothetical protein
MAYNRIGKLGKNGLQEAANRVESIAGLARELGYKKNAGGTYGVIKKYLQLYGIKTDHWSGQTWSKDKRLKDWSQYSKHQNFKHHLIEDRGHACQSCKQTTWMDNRIPLEVHHIDGDRTNNDYENLELLCPNCHSLTDTWKGRNIKR